MTVSVLIPAAGASSRMNGRDKLAELVNGQPLLRLVAKRALAVSDDVVVTLPVGHARRSLLDGLDIRIVEVSNTSEGMSQSLKAGVSVVSTSATGVMILPADMPELTQQDLSKVTEMFLRTGKVTRGATADGVAGHPVIFPRAMFPQFDKLSGDQGARSLISGDDITLVPLPYRHALTDLDTPEDWDVWRSKSET